MKTKSASIPASLRNLLSSPLAAIAVAAVLWAMSGIARGQTTTLIAAKGDLIGQPGEQAALVTAGPAAVDAANHVAMSVTAKGTGTHGSTHSGILFYTGTNEVLVAGVGIAVGADTVTGEEFTKLSDPVLSGSGVVAFLGTLKTGSNGVTSANSKGVWIYQSGTLSIAARTGTPTPVFSGADGTGAFSAFSQIAVNNAGQVAMLATMKLDGGASTTAALETATSGTDALFGSKTSTFSSIEFVPLASVSGQSRSFDTVNGYWTFEVTDKVLRKSYIAILLALPGSFERSARAQVPGQLSNPSLQLASLTALHEPIVNANGNAAFYGLLAGGGIVGSAACVATVTGTSYPTVVAQTGTPAPDATGLSTSGTFTKLSDPVFNNNDHVAFIGTLKTSGTNITSKDDTGIWSDFDGTMKLIVQEGQTEPGGSGGKFSKFNQIVLPDVGGVVFQATLTGVPSSANQGVWAMTAGGLKRVVIAGQQLPYRNATQETVKKIAIFQQAANVLGQSRSFDATTQNLVYQATFTGPGSLWGVYKVTFP